MIPALMIGREGSKGFPGKNTYEVCGNPIMAYPLRACRLSETVDDIYVSTDSEKISHIGKIYGAKTIWRPPKLCTDRALGEDAFVHGYYQIKEEVEDMDDSVDLIVLLHANAPMVTPNMVDDAVRALYSNPELDSAVSVSRYNMFSPVRARRIGEDGLVHPFVPLEALGGIAISCDRDAQGDVWFADVCLSVVRPRCLENIKDGQLPQRWMGKKIYPIINDGGLDIDYEYEVPYVEWWIKKHWKDFV